jgi:hypothetical protein
MDAATREFVRRQAENRCEYCRLRQEHTDLTHHIEHVIARQHGGSDVIGNLALACQRCNLHKGPNLTGIDPLTGGTAALFHPRRDQWSDHLEFDGVRLRGLTAVGRATVALLAMNDARRIELRSEILNRGERP